eukprot:935749-Prymnesium_polylepis.1
MLRGGGGLASSLSIVRRGPKFAFGVLVLGQAPAAAPQHRRRLAGQPTVLVAQLVLHRAAQGNLLSKLAGRAVVDEDDVRVVGVQLNVTLGLAPVGAAREEQRIVRRALHQPLVVADDAPRRDAHAHNLSPGGG